MIIIIIDNHIKRIIAEIIIIINKTKKNHFYHLLKLENYLKKKILMI